MPVFLDRMNLLLVPFQHLLKWFDHPVKGSLVFTEPSFCIRRYLAKMLGSKSQEVFTAAFKRSRGKCMKGITHLLFHHLYECFLFLKALPGTLQFCYCFDFRLPFSVELIPQYGKIRLLLLNLLSQFLCPGFCAPRPLLEFTDLTCIRHPQISNLLCTGMPGTH